MKNMAQVLVRKAKKEAELSFTPLPGHQASSDCFRNHRQAKLRFERRFTETRKHPSSRL